MAWKGQHGADYSKYLKKGLGEHAMARRRKQKPKRIKNMHPALRLYKEASHPGFRGPQFRVDLPDPMGRAHDAHATVFGPGHQHLTFMHNQVFGFGTMAQAAIGQAGFVHPSDKREGDMASPAMGHRLVMIFYRSGRMFLPPSIQAMPILPHMAFGDDPSAFAPSYNKFVSARARWGGDRLWRKDGLYDFVAVMERDMFAQKGEGSALFLHVKLGAHTAGCLATSRAMLRRFASVFAPVRRRIRAGS